MSLLNKTMLKKNHVDINSKYCDHKQICIIFCSFLNFHSKIHFIGTYLLLLFAIKFLNLEMHWTMDIEHIILLYILHIRRHT